MRLCNVLAPTTPMAPATLTTPAAPACVNKVPDCEAKKFLCKQSAYLKLMSEVCAATCGVCASTPVPPTSPAPTCVDKTADCKQMAFLCKQPAYVKLMSEVCAATCGSCTSREFR